MVPGGTHQAAGVFVFAVLLIKPSQPRPGRFMYDEIKLCDLFEPGSVIDHFAHLSVCFRDEEKFYCSLVLYLRNLNWNLLKFPGRFASLRKSLKVEIVARWLGINSEGWYYMLYEHSGLYEYFTDKYEQYKI